MHLLPIPRREKDGIKHWKVILSHPDYAVSNYGDVMRITDGKWPNNAKRGTILKPAIASHGYYNLNLGRKARGRRVCILVAEAFLGPRKKGYVCNHKDGNKLNDKSTNLEWITKSQDLTHAYKKQLRKPKLITHNGVSLTIAQWAARLGISRKTLSSRIHQYNWTIEGALTNEKWINQYT